MRYRSKPSEIEAAHWNGHSVTKALVDLAGDKVGFTEHGLKLLAGKDGAQEWVPVPDGHWIVRQPGDDSDIWPVDPDYFTGKYEPVQP